MTTHATAALRASLQRRRARQLLPLVLSLTVALTAGCGDRATPGKSIERPSLAADSGIDAAGRAEIERRFAAYEGQQGEAERTPTARAATVGSLGRLLDAYELDATAARCYEEAARLAPNDFAWPYLRGHVALGLGDAATASTAFGRALAIRPQEPLAMLGAARAAALTGQWQESREFAQRALGRDPGSAYAWSVLAAALVGERNPAAAADAYRQALRLQPQATQLHGALADLLREAGDAGAAAAHDRLRGPGATGVNDPWLQEVAQERRDADYLRRDGEQAFLAGDLPHALELLQAAVAAAPDDAAARLSLGSALARSGAWQEAAESFRAALRLAPDLALAHFHLALALERNAGELASQDAVAHFREALRLDPELGDARQSLANHLRRRGDCATAEAEYTRLLERDPARAAAAGGLAACLARRKEYAASLAAVDRGLAASPGNGNLLLARARLLASAPVATLRSGAEALALAQAVIAAGSTALGLETLAMALAETGRYPDAIEQQHAALATARAASMSPATIARLETGLERLGRSQPCRDPALD